MVAEYESRIIRLAEDNKRLQALARQPDPRDRLDQARQAREHLEAELAQQKEQLRRMDAELVLKQRLNDQLSADLSLARQLRGQSQSA